MLITGPPPECPHHISCDWWRLISLDDPWQFRELDHGISESQSSAFIWALVSPRPGVKMQLDVSISLEETSWNVFWLSIALEIPATNSIVRRATGTPVPGKSVKVPPGGRGSKMLSHNQATQPPSADYTLPESDFPDVLDHPSTTSFNFIDTLGRGRVLQWSLHLNAYRLPSVSSYLLLAEAMAVSVSSTDWIPQQWVIRVRLKHD